MVTFMIFFRFTEKGLSEIRESPARVRKAKEIAQKHGGNVREFFALTGSYDTVFILDAPGEEAAATIALAIGSQGNVTTEVVRAFTEEEFAKIAAAV
jgi:uncharacterized protein with GYD domain